MKAAPFLLLATSMALPAQAVDLLNQPPPCVAPADMAAGGAASAQADLDPAREAAAGTVPADLNSGPGIDLDVPLYLPPSQGRPGPNGMGSGAAGGDAASQAATNDLVQAGTPVGGVAIRNGKATSVQVFGKEQMQGAPGAPAAPACVR